MKVSKRTILSLCLCVTLISVYLLLITLLSGFRHEYKKFRKFLLTLIAILLLRYILLEHIEFIIHALIATLWDRKEGSESLFKHKQGMSSGDDQTYDPMEFLKVRLNNLKSQLNLDQRHKDEPLNLEYKQLTQELWLFGKYFLLLLLLIIYSRNSYGYYNTATVRSVLNESYFTNYQLEKVLTINDLYFWINNTLTSALNEGYGYDGAPIKEPGWVHFHLAKLIGVVRLQQVRHAKKVKSMTKIYYDEKDYLPNWQDLNISLHYIDKYWRIYYPWLSKHYEGMTNWLMVSTHINSLYSYTKNNGYVVLLARDRKNNEKILKFLKDQNWLDDRTAAIFIDFTLYNVDSNIFSICSILVEQTPFGNLIWEISIQSVELLWNMNEISMWWWLLIGLYVFQLIQFCKIIILRSWFISDFFKSRWNCVDFTIVLLNILLLFFTICREYYILYVMETFVLSKKVDYVDFRVACLFDYVATMVTGFLICLASIRIWKLLQFSSIFRIFNHTLYTSSIPLLSTIMGIHIFLCAIGLSAEILNGNYMEIFSRYLKSITSIMSLSFGFNSHTNSNDLNYGGGVLGFILYLILMFVVAIFLINMFVTLICNHFSSAREERDKESPHKLTYWQFLIMEYSFVNEYFKKFLPYQYMKKSQMVTENIHSYLDKLEEKLKEQQFNMDSSNKMATEDKILQIHMEKVERMQKVTPVLSVQMEILNRLVMVQSLELNSEDEESERNNIVS